MGGILFAMVVCMTGYQCRLPDGSPDHIFFSSAEACQRTITAYNSQPLANLPEGDRQRIWYECRQRRVPLLENIK
jgi:hypothetical protein